MKAEQVIELIQTLGPAEIEKFEAPVDKVFFENDELFRKFAEYGEKERETSVK